MNRSSFLASSASLVALSGALAEAAPAVPGGTHLVERRADFDEAAFAQAVGKAADVRIVIEAVSFHPPVFANIKNALNGLQFGFGYDPSRIAIAFAPHGASSAFTYTDYVWSKYKIGDFFKLKDAQGNAVASNVFLAPDKPVDPSANPDEEHSLYQDTSIESLQKRGVIFLTCHTAVEEQARALLKAGNAPSGMSASDVADDILTHLIAGTHVVPSMMGAIMVLQQRYHYGYQTVDFT
jgi:intracellular sulfur oxidation DsrE/DsrF family protein